MRVAVVLAGLAMSTLAAMPAQAQWRGGYGYHGGYGFRGGYGGYGAGYGFRGGYGYYGGFRGFYAPFYAPRVYYAPPPVYVAPPPVLYAPPPVYVAPRPVAHRPARPRLVQPVSVPCTCTPAAPAAATLPALRPPVSNGTPSHDVYPPEAMEQPHIGN